MNAKKGWLGGWMLFSALALFGQNVSFTGRVLDALYETPLPGATVQIYAENTTRNLIADSIGIFTFSDIVPGKYKLVLRHLGYQQKTIAEFDISSDVPGPVSFYLESTQTELEEVVVKAASRRDVNEALANIHTLTVEETFRFPATFYDPARLATFYPGIVVMNDQSNNISIRGNSPNYLRWYLEDIEIVNPNHTNNAGTLTDRSTQSGGGINILSAQMLDNSTFLTGAFPANFGNALSGVMDMRLRKGANDKIHFTGQLGLIGLDAAIEGPFKSGQASSFLLNYRYSTLGLLSSMGIDLGDDRIQFQDLSFHLHFPNEQKKTSISVFGIGGISQNMFEGPRDPLLWEQFKDKQNIGFNSRMGAFGIRYDSKRFRSTLAFSGNRNERTSDTLDMNLMPSFYEEDLNRESKINMHHIYRLLIFDKGFLDVGLKGSLFFFDLYANGNGRFTNNEANSHLLASYVQSRINITPALTVLGGFHFSSYSLVNDASLEPRLSIRYRFSTRQSLTFSFGKHSILPEMNVLLLDDPSGHNNPIKLIRANHWILNYEHFVSPVSKLFSNIYYQDLTNIPVARDEQRSFSVINTTEFIYPEYLVSEGSGTNVGIEFGYQKYFSKGTFILLNGTIYDSKYQGSDQIKRNTRYNGRYGFNATAGKEFIKFKSKKWRTFGLNLRLNLLGGLWDSPIDVQLSKALNRTIYQEEVAYSNQLPDQLKIDLRIYFRINKSKYNSIFGLDILNATNQKTTLYKYWDPLLNTVSDQEQFGIFPNLSYRVEF